MKDYIAVVEKQIDVHPLVAELAIALDKAETVEQMLKIMEMSEAMDTILKRRSLIDAARECMKVTLFAQRKMGRMLKKIIKKGGDSKVEHSTLDTLGISKTDSQRWQWIAILPEYAFNHYMKNTYNVSVNSAYKLSRLHARFLEIVDEMAMDKTEGRALVKKAILEGYSENQFMSEVGGSEEEDVYDDEEDGDTELIITEDVKAILKHGLDLRLLREELASTVDEADCFIEDDHKILKEAIRTIKEELKFLIEIFKEVKQRFEDQAKGKGDESNERG